MSSYLNSVGQLPLSIMGRASKSKAHLALWTSLMKRSCKLDSGFDFPEFDKFLEEHKSELMKIDDRDDLTDAEYEVQEMDIEQADQEVNKGRLLIQRKGNHWMVQ